MFAERAGWDLEPSPFARAVATARAEGRVRFDLTHANAASVALPGELLAEALAEVARAPASRAYAPEPRGPHAAREAIAAYHASQGATLDPEHVVLTAGTSEGYAHLFRVLADPGERVHLPTPGYPLFDHLAELEGLRTARYRLLPPRAGEAHWPLDLDGLAADLAPESRALVAIHPHNPTGAFVSAAELSSLRSVCAERGIALLADEVFADSGERAGATLLAGAQDGPLCCVLSGASKVLGAPQLKVAWIAVEGPPRRRDALLARLEFVADAFLSVSPLVAAALPALFARRTEIRAALRARVLANRRALAAALAASGAGHALPAEAGWAAIIEVPRVRGVAVDGGEALALAALAQAGVLVHPGSLFELEASAHAEYLVANLLGAESEVAEGAAALAALLARRRDA